MITKEILSTYVSSDKPLQKGNPAVLFTLPINFISSSTELTAYYQTPLQEQETKFPNNIVTTYYVSDTIVYNYLK